MGNEKPILPGESIENAQQRMDGFVRDMMGTLLQFMKEKQYEERQKEDAKVELRIAKQGATLNPER